jgi:hypothetical protein
MRELLRFASGLDGAACRLGDRFAIEGVRFADIQGFGLEEVFPNAKELAVDGCGNSWIIDLTSESKTFAPIFFLLSRPACDRVPNGQSPRFPSRIGPGRQSTLEE